jgi:hypothetical protein
LKWPFCHVWSPCIWIHAYWNTMLYYFLRAGVPRHLTHLRDHIWNLGHLAELRVPWCHPSSASTPGLPSWWSCAGWTREVTLCSSAVMAQADGAQWPILQVSLMTGPQAQDYVWAGGGC